MRVGVGAMVMAALVAAAVVTPSVHAAPAGPPVGPGDLPCPDIVAPGAPASVLALTTPSAAIPESFLDGFGARRFRGVPAIDMAAFSVDAGRVGDFERSLRSLPGVVAVQPDRVMTTSRTPNDPLLRRQWALAKLRATRAWDLDIGVANPVTVAVLDTGVDSGHPDLTGRVLPGFDFVDGDSDATDEQFHGTAVASVIAANTDDHLGMAGLSWGAQVLPVRVLGASGVGSECSIIAGLVWAADKAQILNLSLGSPTACTLLMQEAIDYAGSKGAMVVAAAGNSGAKGNPANEPADCAGAIGVSATDQRDRLAKFSEHGPQIALSAPGVNVLAAYRTPKGGHIWALFSGTSMSAPIVSGVAALVWAEHPAWTAAQVVSRLEATAVDLGRHGRDDYFGAGRVDAGRAVAH